MPIKWEWEQVEGALNELSKFLIELKDDKNTLAVGIQRGGVIPGMLLARKLGLKFDIISPIEPDDNFKSKFKNYNRILFIDDINDSGATLELIGQRMSEVFKGEPEPMFSFATLIRRRGTTQVSYNSLELESNEWVVFPWEYDEEPKKDNLL